MKNKNLWIVGSGICLIFTLFFGCGERAGEKEYNKAVASWKNGDLPRAQGQMEKAIRKLSDKEKKAMANNQLGIILWSLAKNEQAIEQFSESCRLTEELTGANMNLGIALYHAGQLDTAKFEFTKILSEQPRNAMARTFIGLIHMKEKDWKTASEELATGLKANPGDPAGQNALALSQLHMNNGSDNAIARLKQIVVAYPDYAPATYNLAVIHDQWLHNKSAALGWYRQYLQKAGPEATHADTANRAIARLAGTTAGNAARTPKQTQLEAAAQYIAAGSKLHTAKKYNQAIDQYEKAIQADPTQKEAYYNMGLSYYSLKKYPEAIRAYVDALTLEPRDANARYMLVLAYSQQGKWSDAEREAKALKQVDATRGESMLKYISDTRKR